MNTSIKPFTIIVPKVTFLIKQLNLNLRKNTGRPLSLSPEHIISLGIFWKKQGIITKKSLYDMFAPTCTYKTLVVLLKKFMKEVLQILIILMKELRRSAHLVKTY
jgi:hypothetical protein